MRVSTVIIQSLMACIMFSCTDKQSVRKDMRTLTVPISEQTERASITDIASRLDYIPLETNDSVLIHEIVSIRKDKDSYYVSDGLVLYRFNKEGKLTGKIDKRGNGPDEYINITDFQVTPEGDVWLLCRNQKQIKKYAWNGNPLQTISLEHWVEKFFLQGDLMYLYGGNETGEGNGFKIHILDYASNKIISKYLPINEYQSKYLHVKLQQCFLQTEESLYFYQVFNDTIYKLSQDMATSYLYVNLGDRNIPFAFYNQKYQNIMEFFQKLMKESYAYGLPSFGESSSSYIFSFIYNEQQYLISYPKKEERKVWMATHCVVGDDMLRNFKIDFTESSFYTQKDGDLLMALNSDQIMEYAQTNNRLDILKPLQLSDAEQNPVLIDIKLK